MTASETLRLIAKQWCNLSDLMKLAGVKRINIHGFRHSCASVLIHGKTPITVVSNYLGHADSTETLETYAHMFEDDLNDVPKYIDNMLDDLAKKFTNPIETN